MNYTDIKRTYFVTKDYGKFKKLKGNRDVADIRKRKIISSIEKVGWVENPIIVNENMEVIDGQGRLDALKELDMEVPYIVAIGAGKEQCIQMNIGQTNWRLMDYILSYAETGDKPYIYLASLCDKYREFDPKTIASITKGVVEISSSVIRNGVFQMSDEDYYRTAKTLDFIEGLYGSIKSIPGQTAVAVTCIAWAINNTGASKDRIYRAITDNAPLFKPLVRTGYDLFLEDLSFYYNKNLKTKESKISFDSLWKLKSLREG